ncbi:MAG: glutamate dehydrogenase [Chlamydiae bacterium]|nr:glutamate dehydrogenase [Chlamydiota bacterium]
MSIDDNSKEKLKLAIAKEIQSFEETYDWLKQHMPPSFFEEIKHEDILLITHSLMGLDHQSFFSNINTRNTTFSLCLDSPSADLKILSQYQMQGIKNYKSFISDAPPSFPNITQPLKISVTGFWSGYTHPELIDEIIPKNKQQEIFDLLIKRNPNVKESDFLSLLNQLNSRFLRALSEDRLAIALDMFFRAKDRDNCQYEVKYNLDWREKNDVPSMQIVLAWRNVPKSNFLYKIAKTIHRHGLSLKRMNATYIDSQSKQPILIMSLAIDGQNFTSAWEACDIQDFLRELVTIKYFDNLDLIESTFVDTKICTGNLGNFLKSATYFVHQTLLHANPNLYTLQQIEEDICRHPEIIGQIIKAFEHKFHPEKNNFEEYQNLRGTIYNLIEGLDTGNHVNDSRRKNVLKQMIGLIEFCLKTNFYRNNKTAHCFRLDPAYLDNVPYLRKEKFPELPYAIFFMKGLDFLGFHIRFKDLSRGGLRTVVTERSEQMVSERNNVFLECYNLAYTQQKKNKDIPEGGAKGVIFVEPQSRLQIEKEIYKKEIIHSGETDSESISAKLDKFSKDQKLEHMYQAQRSYIESFVTLLNCEPDGKIKAKNITDYWKKPEYVYLGPDENMHNQMIEWIAAYSKYYGYKPGGAFISSKPSAGINHKEFGVTSLGVNVYVEEVLSYLGIDPEIDSFTIKMTGGPDGDVAGNEMSNLFALYPNTAKLLATIDVSGTIFDPKGLDLREIYTLFKEQKPIRYYPAEKLSEGGFLLDTKTKKEQSTYVHHTLCWKKINGRLTEDWLSGSDMNYLLRHNVHQTKAEIFVPGGGRPRTLNESNVEDFLDENGNPTAKAIVEGANLYLTPGARNYLEKLGVLIIKDSSSNKGGVTCSSFEVLCSLCLTEEEFLKEKSDLVPQILEIIKSQAKDEAQLLLRTHKETGKFLTEISDEISNKINTFMYEFLDYFTTISLSNNPKDPLIQALINYCPPLIREKYQERILTEIPDIHKKAIIACHLASRLVYRRGLEWSPRVVDVLPLITQDPKITSPSI